MGVAAESASSGTRAPAGSSWAAPTPRLGSGGDSCCCSCRAWRWTFTTRPSPLQSPPWLMWHHFSSALCFIFRWPDFQEWVLGVQQSRPRVKDFIQGIEVYRDRLEGAPQFV